MNSVSYSGCPREIHPKNSSVAVRANESLDLFFFVDPQKLDFSVF